MFRYELEKSVTLTRKIVDEGLDHGRRDGLRNEWLDSRENYRWYL